LSQQQHASFAHTGGSDEDVFDIITTFATKDNHRTTLTASSDSLPSLSAPQMSNTPNQSVAIGSISPSSFRDQWRNKSQDGISLPHSVSHRRLNDTTVAAAMIDTHHSHVLGEMLKNTSKVVTTFPSSHKPSPNYSLTDSHSRLQDFLSSKSGVSFHQGVAGRTVDMQFAAQTAVARRTRMDLLMGQYVLLRGEDRRKADSLIFLQWTLSTRE